MKVIKRDGRAVDYDSDKIRIAIGKANSDVPEEEKISSRQIENIIKYVESLNKKRILVEDIQDIIEKKLMEMKKFDLGKAYILYRYNRALVRKSNTTDESILSLIRTENRDVLNSNTNKNTTLAYMQREYIAGEVSRDLTNRVLLPEKISKAFEDGILYFHAADYFVSPIFNSSLSNLDDMLENGTVINGKEIKKPRDFSQACLVTTQIIMSALPNQYGGISIDIKDLAKYLRLSKNRIKKDMDIISDKDENAKIIDQRLKDEVKRGVTIINSQVNSLMTTNGINSEITIFVNLDTKDKYIKEIELIACELLEQKILEDNYRVVYVLNKQNNLTGGKYDYLTDLAVKCILKGRDITFLSEKKMKENYNDNLFSPIGRHHFLLPFKQKNEYKYSGRFNQGLVSINLPQIAIISKSEDKFFDLLDERLELCFEALMCKYYSLLGTSSAISPVHYNYGLISRLELDDRIDEVLRNDYSTLSLGYCGLSEAVKMIKDSSLSSEEGKKNALKILKTLRTKVNKWRKETGIGFVLYATTSEKTCSYFAGVDKEHFGNIKNITDKSSYTKAYYLDLNDNIDVYERLELENEFLELSNGGGISIIDVSTSDDSAIRKYIRFVYDNVLYIKFINKD